MSLRVAVGSTNPVKIEAVRQGFSAVFTTETIEVIGVSVDSGVSVQPLSDAETRLGAISRAKNAQVLRPNAQFYVGLEGGAEDVLGELHEFAWMAVRSSYGKMGEAKSFTFIAPPVLRKSVIEDGMEVGPAADIIFKEKNVKQRMGVCGLLTKGLIDRVEMYRPAVIMALVPFIQPELYK